MSGEPAPLADYAILVCATGPVTPTQLSVWTKACTRIGAILNKDVPVDLQGWAGRRRLAIVLHDSASMQEVTRWWGRTSRVPLPLPPSTLAGNVRVEFHSTEWIVRALKALQSNKRAPAPGPDECMWSGVLLAQGRGQGRGGGGQSQSQSSSVEKGNPSISSAEGQSQSAALKQSTTRVLAPGMRWVLYQAPSLEALYALGDDAARWGADTSRPPMACPFKYDQLVQACGRLLRLYPWLVVITDEQRGGGGEAARTGVAPDDRHKQALRAVQSKLKPGAYDSQHVEVSLVEGEGSAAGGSSSYGGGARLASVKVNPFGLSSGTNLNTHLTRPLSVLMDGYELMPIGPAGEVAGKAKMLGAVLGTLTSLPYKVKSVSDVSGLPGFGPSTIEKIAEILDTGVLARAEELQADPSWPVLTTFKQVLWAGPITAKKWYAEGFRSLDDLRCAAAAACTHPQRVGLAYFEELGTRASRRESEAVAALVQAECSAIIPGSLCVLGGSYRRGQPSSSDFDFIVSAPPPYGTCDLLPRLYRRLKARGLLSDDLMMTWGTTSRDGGPQDVVGAHTGNTPVTDLQAHVSVGAGGGVPHFVSPLNPGYSSMAQGQGAVGDREEDGEEPDDPANAEGVGEQRPAKRSRNARGDGRAGTIQPHDDFETGESCTKYLGIWFHAGGEAVHRRIDIIAFHWRQVPPALVSWTGNTPFNRSLRSYVDAIGYSLDDRALLSPTDIRDAHAHEGGSHKRKRLGAAEEEEEREGMQGSDSAGHAPPPVPGVPLCSEFDLFSFLGLRYIPPDERSCFGTFAEAGGVGEIDR